MVLYRQVTKKEGLSEKNEKTMGLGEGCLGIFRSVKRKL